MAAAVAAAEESSNAQSGEELDTRGVDPHALREAQHAILTEADVICSQLITAGGDFLQNVGPMRAMLIDEVAQATELNTVVPIIRRGCERLVLVGDHCQLPPSVRSREAEARGLSLSLFGRLIAHGATPFFLDTQYRAHPELMHFSSEVIYQGQLRSGISAADRPPVGGFGWPRADCPLAFVEVDGQESVEHESKLNRAEAERLIDVLAAVIVAGGANCADVGVVTPYAAQVRLLRHLWRERSVRLGATQARSVEIASVDGFQGREKDLILFSAVRANRAGRVGFLSDWRRMNVLLTRSRRGLIVFGHAATLRHDPLWQQWLEFAASKGAILDRRRWLATLSRAIHTCEDADDEVAVRSSLLTLQVLDGAPDHSAAALRSHVQASLPGTKLRSATASAMCTALRAAANGWRGIKHEMLALLGAASGGEMDAAKLVKAVLERHRLTHPRALAKRATGQMSAKEQRTALKARVVDAVVRLTRHVGGASGGRVARASAYQSVPPCLTSCEWNLTPGAPPPTEEDADQAERRCIGLVRQLQQAARSKGNKRGRSSTAKSVLASTPGPRPAKKRRANKE